jgi:hypothetical protein
VAVRVDRSIRAILLKFTLLFHVQRASMKWSLGSLPASAAAHASVIACAVDALAFDDAHVRRGAWMSSGISGTQLYCAAG